MSLRCVPVLTLAIAVSVAGACHGYSPQRERAARATPKKTAPSEPVDLNEASETELKAVPGITTRTARKIIEGRPYSSIDELSNAGLTPATIKRIRKNVTVTGQVPHADRSLTMKQPAPGGDMPGMVWITPGSKIYHVRGDKWFGKTKGGRYMQESEAIAAGYRSSKER